MVLLIAALVAVLASSVVSGQANCTEPLTGDGTVTGEWTSACESEERAGRYARYYTFSLAESSDVTITLSRTSGTPDTYLYVWESSALSGDPVAENDDVGENTTVSRIEATLDAGDYAIEATTYEARETGGFSLAVTGIERAAPIPTPEPEPEWLTLTQSGHFHHEPEDGHIEVDRAGVDVYDVSASAMFVSPYDTEEHAFSFGFLLRLKSGAPPLVVAVRSNGTWQVRVGDEIVQTGQADNVRGYRGSYNWFDAVVIGEWISLALNDELLTDSEGNSEFHVGPDTVSGDLFVAAGMWRGTERSGAITEYEHFEVWKMPPEEEEEASIAGRSMLEG